MSWSGSLELKRDCECSSARNPPSAVDVRGISDVVSELGRALAVGELGASAGMPDGAELVEQVVRFVDTSPTLARAYRSVETGSIASAALKPAWKAVRGAANDALGVMRRNRALLGTAAVIGGGFALGSSYFDSQERVALTEIATRYALVGDQLAELPAHERAAALAKLGDIIGPGGSGGVSLWTLAGLGLVVVGGLWAWRKWGAR